MKFPKISALLGLKSESEALTDAHMTAAEATLGALQASETELKAQVTTLTGQLSTATSERDQAKADLTTAQGDLTTAKDTIETLEQWKREQAIVDGRQEDASNQAERTNQPKAAFESEAEAHIARVRERLK